jgi:elongation factor 1-beta
VEKNNQQLYKQNKIELNMGFAIVKMKLMPSSPEADLNKIEEKIKEILKNSGAGSHKIEREPIAFGLNAIILMFTWPEEKELENLEASLKNLENINSAEIVDMRREVG